MLRARDGDPGHVFLAGRALRVHGRLRPRGQAVGPADARRVGRDGRVQHRPSHLQHVRGRQVADLRGRHRRLPRPGRGGLRGAERGRGGARGGGWEGVLGCGGATPSRAPRTAGVKTANRRRGKGAGRRCPSSRQQRDGGRAVVTGCKGGKLTSHSGQLTLSRVCSLRRALQHYYCAVLYDRYNYFYK
ncbi:hypothetical protein FOCC_FOCC009333 [Frankliniella occidentalis]|nr:hypothetical protein FOCC_FOCC009333 [Frankliniella occidentalis]